MKWYKIISAVLHPIVMPTIGVLIYLIITPINIPKSWQHSLVGVVFFVTYVVPTFMLLFLKYTRSIKSTKLPTVQERKVPVFFMIILFFIIGNSFYKHLPIRDLSHLFYGVSLGLAIIYFLLYYNLKISLHLVSMGSAVGFFFVFQFMYYHLNILPLISVLLVLSGLLSSSRLYLKAHTLSEVYIGFLTGVFSQVLCFLHYKM